MPRKPRPRARPAAPRKKGRRRPPPASALETGGSVVPRAAPVVPPSRPAAEATAAARLRAQDYSYVLRELRRIAIISAATLLLVVVLSFVLG